MSEIWTRLIDKLDDALKSALTLERVTVSRSSGDMCVYFEGARMIEERERAQIERAMASGFTGAKLKVVLRYTKLKHEALGDIQAYSKWIAAEAVRLSPASMPYLMWKDAIWKLENGCLTICVSGREGAEFLKYTHVDDIIKDALKRMFNIEASVSFLTIGDDEERLRRIAINRREEEARIAKAALEQALKQQAHAEADESAGEGLGEDFTDPIMSLSELTEDAGRVAIRGEVVKTQLRDMKNGAGKILTFTLTDYEGSVDCKVFLSSKRGRNAMSVEKQIKNASVCVKEGLWLKVRGEYKYDDYDRGYMLHARDIIPAAKPTRVDTADEKRVELHLHTKMSAMDACASATDYINQAAAWGHSAIAITDHGVVQAFPEAFAAAKRAKIKLIPGCEAYMIEDFPEIVSRADERALSETKYVVLDVETTGLNTAQDSIIEIGAVRIENCKEVKSYSQLIDPERPIPQRATELNGIDAAMVRGMPKISDVINEFAELCSGCVLVAHNAPFDMAFIARAFEDAGIPLDNPVLDTLALTRNYYKNLKSHKLGQLCKALDIKLTRAHRAVHDARATSEVLLRTLDAMNEAAPLTRLDELNRRFQTDAGGDSHHIILLAASRKGMTNLNHLVSDAHLKYFHRTPRIPRSVIQKYREDIIVGSACEAGELFRAVRAGKSDAEIEQIAKFYDYLEIQPLGNNEFLVREGAVKDADALKRMNRRIVDLGKRMGKPVAATGDVHFKEPKDAIFRAILMASKGFEDADNQAPLYFRTTDDMLEEFAYLGREDAYDVVVRAPNQIAERVEHIVDLFMRTPQGGETFQPYWEEAEAELTEICETRAREIFGDNPPEVVRARMDKELGAINRYGFATLYMIAVKLVRKSLGDGYVVGARGSVGSSFVAKLAGITEVDALPPYYVCPKCKHAEFDVPKQYTCGPDLPLKDCPECATLMLRDGFNIPFEVFLGFEGDKVPDIDLNFSGVYQPQAHAYVKELFGAENVFRAGTLGTVADKTAFGYVLKYAEERNLVFTQPEKERLARGITGVKRTTGQHPAGMVVLPKGYEIYQFTAIQHPADDTKSDTVTTHYDFTSMHDVLVKLDVLGHDDPTMLRNLQDITGIAPDDIPLGDPEIYKTVISLFSSPRALGLTEQELRSPSGTLGVPEFGTPFVRGMLADTRPGIMEELVRISGLSHGTGVWLGNVQDILKTRQADLRHCICTRDDIMNQLIEYGVEPSMAFAIMEHVRKGFAAHARNGELKPAMREALLSANLPDWFIGACNKIEYLFPKAHAVAYVTMAMRISYFKIYHPTAYYACFLQRNRDEFDGVTMTDSIKHIEHMITQIDALDKAEREKHEAEYALLESLREMNLRGISCLPPDLYLSDPEKFIIVDDTHLLAPLSSIKGLALNAAHNLAAIRARGKFLSCEDMVRRKVGKAVVEALKQAGCLKDMPESSQVSLFD